LHLVGILFPHINDDARSKPHQTSFGIFLSVQHVTLLIKQKLLAYTKHINIRTILTYIYIYINNI